jgi:RHS repeat-associated protein
LQTAQGATTTESYSCDPVGNRRSSLGVSSYTSNPSNELTATSSASYAYDYNGNTTSETDSGGTTVYGWDFDNHLAQVTLPGASGTVTFKYDPFGRRIYKQSPSATIVFVYDGDNLIETVNATGNEVARFTQGLSIDESLAMQRGTTTDYYEADGLGSITSLSNSVGTIANTYTYDSFGNTTNSTGSVANFFRYAAREFDTETNLYYYRARYFDPGTGRFLSEDPIGLNGGINLYRYSFNSPTINTDPSGLCPPKKKGCDAAFPSNPTTANLAQLVYAEGNGSAAGDLTIASVVVNDANYGNPAEFGSGIIGVINKKFAATGNDKFNSVSDAAKVAKLNAANCRSYKNAALAASAAQSPGGTNTDALFYFDTSMGAPAYLRNGIAAGFIIPAAVSGGIGEGNNYLVVPIGGSGNDQVFFTYSDYSH